MLFALLLGKPGVSMNFGNALVTGIRKAFGSLFQINPAVLKQPEIMPATFGKSGAEYLSAFIVRDNLRLLRMALLFAGIAQSHPPRQPQNRFLLFEETFCPEGGTGGL